MMIPGKDAALTSLTGSNNFSSPLGGKSTLISDSLVAPAVTKTFPPRLCSVSLIISSDPSLSCALLKTMPEPPTSFLFLPPASAKLNELPICSPSLFAESEKGSLPRVMACFLSLLALFLAVFSASDCRFNIALLKVCSASFSYSFHQYDRPRWG